MTPIEAAELLHSAGVERVHVSPDGAILGVMRRGMFAMEGGSRESRGRYQLAERLQPPLREACEVYMAWLRSQPREPLAFGWLGNKPDEAWPEPGQDGSAPDWGALLRAAGCTPTQSHEGATWTPPDATPRECHSDEHEPGVVTWTGDADSRCPACERISDLYDRIDELNEWRE